MTPSRPLTTKQQEWLSHVVRAQQQGLSLQEYARRNDINASSLYAARKVVSPSRPKVLPSGVSFTEVRTTEPCVNAVCTLQLAHGIRLQLSALPSPQWLAAVCAQWSPRS